MIAIIPARSGSKRIPNKNVRELNGKPLIEYTIIAAMVCNLIDRVVITSDCCERFAARYGTEYVDRPDNLCGDDVGDYEVLYHTVAKLNLKGLIAYLRPTTPFRIDYHMCEAIKRFEAIPEATGLRSVEEMAESAYKCFEMKGERLKPVKYFTYIHGRYDLTDKPNDLCPKTYHPNGYIDITHTDNILSGKIWGDQIIGYVTPRTIEIDTMDDWEYAEWYARRQLEPHNLIFGKEDLKS